MSKLIVVFGGTGKQGGSVIDTFLKDPTWKIRAVTRRVDQPKCKDLQDKGVEVVHGQFDDVQSLISAVQGANVVFGVTDYWAPFFSPATIQSLGQGQLINEYCHDIELQHGKNIADAVASVADSSLDLFVWSTLSHASKWSNGKYQRVYHFDSKALVDEYIKSQHPNLFKKTSTVQIGFYADNWLAYPHIAPIKGEDGVYELANLISSTIRIPLVDARRDTGKFVRALVKSPPGKAMLGVSEYITIGDYLTLWGEIVGVPTRYKQVPAEEFRSILPDSLGAHLEESYMYNAVFGWDGGDPDILQPQEFDLEEPLTSAKEYIESQDWSPMINKN